ncbi:hypothetical protein Glove_21g263 [Diversispora epigaea]|uniref:Uncharacterized protein n=1 Tax=Diversispora epigaea TaxID=1348612 RepID=A0A397JKH0_9GLOM|nr:hypothetical protein Glove_21g263 [Diversispora epigaea]
MIRFCIWGTNWIKNSTSQIMGKLINTFDTTSKEWSNPQIEGEPIRRRDYIAGYTATLLPNGIWYYNVYWRQSLEYKLPSPDGRTNFIVLNTTIFPFEWYSPDYSRTNEPSGLEAYSANFFENYMIIGFGDYTWISYYERLPNHQYDQHIHHQYLPSGNFFNRKILQLYDPYELRKFLRIRNYINNSNESPDFLVFDTGVQETNQISQNEMPQNTR